MGFLDLVKGKFGSSGKRIKDDEITSYLKASRDNLKLASDQIGKFLETMRDFQPARRHEELYYVEVREKLVGMKSGMNKGLVFLDERMNNTYNTMNAVKSPEQLKDMIGTWVKNIKADDDKVYDILKILQVEMWSPDKLSRGFPVPMNKGMVLGHLTNSVGYLTEAKNQIDSYIVNNVVPEVD